MEDVTGRMEKAKADVHVLRAENVGLCEECKAQRGKSAVQDHKMHECC